MDLVKKFPAFLEPESSSPYSQVPATFPYPEPTPSSPHIPLPLPEDHLNIILPFASGSPQWSLSLRFPHQNPVTSDLTVKKILQVNICVFLRISE